MPNICFITLNFDLSFIVILISGFIQGLFEVDFKKVNQATSPWLHKSGRYVLIVSRTLYIVMSEMIAVPKS